MPDLIGLPSGEAGRRLGQIEAATHLELSSSWRRPVDARCETRPGTVVWQRPASGTPLERGTVVDIRTAALNLKEFRGPCEPTDGDLGPVTGPDAALARQFYRFAADTELGAPFATGELWVGIESGQSSTTLTTAELADPVSWHLRDAYAERLGPFSALDILAGSGGYYQLHDGVAATCPMGNDKAPAELAGLRAISLTTPADIRRACLDWWAVTLFLDGEDHIRGVALRLGSP
jgi:hypothetical protein